MITPQNQLNTSWNVDPATFQIEAEITQRGTAYDIDFPYVLIMDFIEKKVSYVIYVLNVMNKIINFFLRSTTFIKIVICIEQIWRVLWFCRKHRMWFVLHFKVIFYYFDNHDMHCCTFLYKI